MRLLVLGGTSWLGGAVAAAGVAAGHEVTCLARGASGSVPAGATLVPANRGSLSAYDELGHFDAAIEVSWQPSFVAGALQHVRADHWVYVSSVSVYSDRASVAHGTVGKLLPEWSGTGIATREVYGEAKVACEKAYERALPASSYAVARAGLIGGYGDLTDRLGYWPGRVALAEGARRRVLVPAPTSTSVQVIDVLDLAAWLLHCATARVSGVYDAVGPHTTLQDVLDTSAAAAGTSPELVPVDGDRLIAAGVNPWMGPDSLPLWAPALGDFMSRSVAEAEAAGLLLRPVAETVADALRWERELGLTRERSSGLSPALEDQVLQGL